MIYANQENCFKPVDLGELSEVALDGYPTYKLASDHNIHILINRLLEEVFQQKSKSEEYESWKDLKWKEFSAFKEILKSSSELKIQTIHAAFVRMDCLVNVWDCCSGYERFFVQKSLIGEDARKYVAKLYILPQLIKAILSQDLEYSDLDFQVFIEFILKSDLLRGGFTFPISSLLTHIEKYVDIYELSQDLRAALEKLTLKRYEENITKTQINRIQLLLGSAGLEFGEAWSEAALADLAEMNTSLRSGWQRLMNHALTASATEPPSKWLKQAQVLLEALGQTEFKHSLLKWLPLFKDPGENIDPTIMRQYNNSPPPSSDRNITILKGLVWCCTLSEDEEIIQATATLADDSFKKIPDFGPRSLKVGNACLYTLSVMPGKLAISHLERLRQKCKNGSVKKQIEKAFDRAAQRAGLSREDLAEVMLPTYDLTPQGIATHTLGDFTAEIRIFNTHSVTLNWLKADGKPQKSVPAAVKKDHAPTLKTLKRTVDDIQKLLVAQRDRLESLYLNPRTWNFATWQERYLQHPLLFQLAQRLIWQFEHEGSVTLGIWHEGKLVDEGDRPLATLTDNTQVTLWHPIHNTPATVLAWRTWLETHQIVQPFKQAHREVYLLTDAELQTDIYSNRFAAHILRQHQFAALAQQTDWRYSLQGHFDGHNVPTRDLSQWNLRIEYWVDIAGDELSHAGISLYLATDQVRFCNREGVPQSLERIPAIAFTEVMRNIDLFVGVASIGNDPSWQDQGAQPRYNAYWESYSFGELNTSAQIRREVLSRLLPKLKIGDRCSLSEKFLVVQGTLRTYNIHLGSGNILMEPNSQYLCIVPNHHKSATESIFLPFEGDTTLSVILSKAFLLAEDAKIQDPTILSQIKRK
jgi:Domain of unknown function (DUF4132)